MPSSMKSTELVKSNSGRIALSASSILFTLLIPYHDLVFKSFAFEAIMPILRYAIGIAANDPEHYTTSIAAQPEELPDQSRTDSLPPEIVTDIPVSQRCRETGPFEDEQSGEKPAPSNYEHIAAYRRVAEIAGAGYLIDKGVEQLLQKLGDGQDVLLHCEHDIRILAAVRRRDLAETGHPKQETIFPESVHSVYIGDRRNILGAADEIRHQYSAAGPRHSVKRGEFFRERSGIGGNVVKTVKIPIPPENQHTSRPLTVEQHAMPDPGFYLVAVGEEARTESRRPLPDARNRVCEGLQVRDRFHQAICKSRRLKAFLSILPLGFRGNSCT